ncbi:MAG: sugar phosphate nucleotidyltransferase [Candidatus Zixiibacteriota bacterium]
MRVVIPVAGSGTRLRPHTYSQPKPLLEVGGKPIIAHLLDPIVKLHPEEVIFVIGYMGERIREYVESNYSFKATFVEQDKLLGLGYALHMAIRGISGGDVLILLGDTIVCCDLTRFVNAGDSVLGVLPVDDPQRFGVVTIKDGRVTKLVEKPEHPESNLALIGLYYFRDVVPIRDVLGSHVESGRMTRGEIQFTDALQMLLDRGAVMVPHEVREWFDCGKKETMLSTNRHLVAEFAQNRTIAGSTVKAPVFIHSKAQIVNSEIGPSVSISEGTVVRNSRIEDSIIGRNCMIEDTELRESLIGNEVKIRGGRMTVNLGDSSEVEAG